MSKTGFIYYNVDTDRYQDRRIKRLKKDLGCMGLAVYDYVLCEIYRVQGCFIVWDEDAAFDVAEYFNLKDNQVDEVIKLCCNMGLFDKDVYTSGGILTSHSIQQRYLEICRIAKRKNINIPENIKLFPEKTLKIQEEMPKILEVLPQSKVKYSKVNNISLNTGDITQEERERFLEILFFEKGVLYPHKELSKFINHYQARQWRDANGIEIADRQALLQNWEPRKVESNRAFIWIWKEIYTALDKVENKEILLTEISKIEVEENSVKFHLTKILAKFLEDHITEWTSVFRKYFKNKTLSYKFI